MLDVGGERLTAADRELLCHPQVGGVILFTRNYAERGQLRALIAEVHALRSPRLLVAVDHEGGRVQRFREGFSALPPMREIGARAAEAPGEALAAAREQGRVIAAELTACGIDLPFAPVLDCDRGVAAVIGDRAIAADGDTIVALASAFCDGLVDGGGMAATGKHFPGHGGVTVDSHEALPEDPRSLEALRASCLLPFAGMIRRGIASLMTAHIRFPAVDDLPVTFSRRWLGEILRGELGFAGVIVSDDLGMGAAGVINDPAERVTAAHAAGCELILFCNDRAAAERAVDAPLPAVQRDASTRLEALRAQAVGDSFTPHPEPSE
jgi:beta-N-acetylhexosaminidase